MRQALLLIDHGSRRADANEALAQVVATVQALVGDAVIVRDAHMDLATPTIRDGFHACVTAGAEEVVAVPFFLFPGRHAVEDVPRLVAEAADEHPGVRHRVTETLGLHPLLARVVLELAGIPLGAGDGQRAS
jgi:sirohydrochlorin ferrochelatase